MAGGNEGGGEWEVTGQIVQGLVGHGEDFGLYPE